MIRYDSTVPSKWNICFRTWMFSMTCCLFISCNTQHGKTGSLDTEGIPVASDSIIFKAGSSALTLKSYGINSFLIDDATILGYNYKTHSIDVFGVAEKSLLRTIPLDNQGPDAVQMSVRYIKAYAPDSIAVYDDNGICLIDSAGKVFDRIMLPYNGMTRIDCNSRSNMSAFHIDFKDNRIIYPVRDGERNFMVDYDFKNDSVVRKITLKNPTGTDKHGFMDFPNVNFNGDKIIYNYPFEHKAYVYDMTTGMTREAEHKCPYLNKEMEGLSDESPDGLTWYGIENYFYSPLYYLERKKCYVRLALDGTELSRSEGPDRAMYARPMYITVFNEQFEPVGEVILQPNRYDPFGGWFVMSDRFCMFRNNILDDLESEETIIDMLDF